MVTQSGITEFDNVATAPMTLTNAVWMQDAFHSHILDLGDLRMHPGMTSTVAFALVDRNEIQKCGLKCKILKKKQDLFDLSRWSFPVRCFLARPTSPNSDVEGGTKLPKYNINKRIQSVISDVVDWSEKKPVNPGNYHQRALRIEPTNQRNCIALWSVQEFACLLDYSFIYFPE